MCVAAIEALPAQCFLTHLSPLLQAEGDEFEVRVDFPAATIEFVRNGSLQYTVKGFDTKREQHLCVCLYHRGNKITQLLA